jgi:hypothetical protein
MAESKDDMPTAAKLRLMENTSEREYRRPSFRP